MTRKAKILKAFCILFSAFYLSSAQQFVDSFSDEDGFSDEDDSQPCVLRIDERTTETRLRTAIFLADLEKAANILSTSNEAFSLGAGLTYTPEQACLFVRSDDITRDPDIVAIKALALSAERTGDTEKLSTAIAASFQLPCQCVFTPAEIDVMKLNFKAILDNPAERRFILDFGGPQARSSVPSPTSPRLSTSPDLPTGRQSRASPSSLPVFRSFRTDAPSSSNIVDGMGVDDEDIAGAISDDVDEEDAFNGGFAFFFGSVGRRLQQVSPGGQGERNGTPTTSFVCGTCRPPRTCNGVVRWCP